MHPSADPLIQNSTRSYYQAVEDTKCLHRHFSASPAATGDVAAGLTDGLNTLRCLKAGHIAHGEVARNFYSPNSRAESAFALPAIISSLKSSGRCSHYKCCEWMGQVWIGLDELSTHHRQKSAVY